MARHDNIIRILEERTEKAQRAINENNNNGPSDIAVERYSTDERQERLRKRIEAQDLPVRERLAELIASLTASFQKRGGLVLFQGETGSGKSVYSPLAVRKALEALGLPDRIVMMQPRRDAASGIARATAAVMNEQLGQGVGFSTSEFKKLNRNSFLNVVTSGIFLRHLIEGRLTKEQVGGLIIDEIHEGSIDYHLVLGLLKIMRKRGQAPLILLTSATLNKEGIQNFFEIDDSDYLRIEGRAHAVDIHYLTESEVQAMRNEGVNYIMKTAEKVRELCLADEEDGDILVFMPGRSEIRETIKLIGDIKGVEILPLYGGLPPEDRDKALSGEKGRGIKRRVIVATNIAETSVTVPDIKIVIDSCRQRSVRYDPEAGITSMGTELISQDQAAQRAGRAGRIAPGKCYRIITQKEYAEMPQHPESEIKKVNLSNLVLYLVRLGINSEDFPFIEPPKPKAIAHAIAELQQIEALTKEKHLTRIGREIAKLPFEPRLARMIVEARQRQCVEAALVLALFSREGSNLLLGPTKKEIEEASGWNEKEKRKNARLAIQRKQAIFSQQGSDFLKALNIFAVAIENGVFEAAKRIKTPEGKAAKKRFKRWCREYYLNERALIHIAYKLSEYARHARVRLNYKDLPKQLREVNKTALGAVILAGYIDQLIYDTGNYRGLPVYHRPGDYTNINLSPGSEAFNTRPLLCITTNIQEGSGTLRGHKITRIYAHNIHPVSLELLREVAPHLIIEEKKSPYYDPATDSVKCQVIFYLKDSNNTQLGEETRPVKGESAVQAFAQALAERKVELECIEHNQKILQYLKKLYHRSKGRVQAPNNMANWYAEHLGGAASKAEAVYIDNQLRLSLEDFYSSEMREELDRYYPEKVNIKGHEYSVNYYYQSKDEYWYKPESFSATVVIEPDELFDIEQSDIPILGRPEEPLNLTIRTDNDESANIKELKIKIDKKRIEEHWRNWKGKPKPTKVILEPLKPLPAIKAEPIQYAVDHDGNPVMAYPAITIKQKYNYHTGEYEEEYYLIYYPNKKEAQKAQQLTEERKRDLDRQEQRRLDRKVMLKSAQEKLEVITARKPTILELYEGGQLDHKLYLDLSEALNEARRLLSSKDPDPRQALKKLELIENFFTRIESIKDERPQLLPQVKKLRDSLQELVDEVLDYYNYSEYGLTFEDYQELNSIWNQANQLIENKYGDLNRALELLKEVQSALDTEQVKAWASPAAVLFKEVRDNRRQGIYATITIEDGQVFNAQGELVNKFIIGKSGRSMIACAGNDGRVRVQGFYASGNPMTKVIILEDGSYAISRNAEHIFKVELNPKTQEVTAVYGEVDTRGINEPDLNLKESDQPRLIEDTNSVFGRAFAALEGSNPPGESSKPPVQSQSPSTKPKSQKNPASLTKSPEKTHDRTITEQDRLQLLADLQYIKILVNILKDIIKTIPKSSLKSTKKGKRVKIQETPKQKAAREITEMISGKKTNSQEVLEILRNLESKLGQPNTTLNAMRSELGRIRSRIERLFKRQVYQITGESSSWLDDLKRTLAQVPSAVAEHEDAQEFIKEGLIETEAIIKEVFKELQTAARDIQTGKKINMDEVIEKVLERI